MISLRLVTAGLDPSVHDVIGYYLNDEPIVYIKPREGSTYSFEAMHDVNNLTIKEVYEKGGPRKETLLEFVNRINNRTLLVWYAPFIRAFLRAVEKELGVHITVAIVDAYALARTKEFEVPDYHLPNVLEYTGKKNLEELYQYLQTLPDAKRIRRL